MATALYRIGLKRYVLAAAVLTAAAVIAPRADAAMAVYDAANHEAALKDLAEAMKTVKELESILGQANQIRGVLGAVGGSSSGIGGFGSGISSTISGMQCLFPTMSSWGIPRSVTPNFGSVCSSRKFIDEMFTLPDPNDPASRSRVGQVNRDTILKQRQTVYREAAMNGLALAYQQKQDVPQSTQRAQAAAAEAAAAPDIHSDLQVTNKLLVMMIEQQIATRMLTAGMLEVIAAQQIQSVPITFYGELPAATPASANSGQFGE